ncbi:MAG: Group II intron-encoded protein LtrA [Smithella sp. PtaU1.Bin162]|nr:MAG: Group II intron-encoded protein LtrA [Smithella sp. PtaU1.Bin162]
MVNELRRIAEIAKEEKKLKFISLAHLLNQDNLRVCFHLLKAGKATGIDKVGIEEYEANLESNLTRLVERLKRKTYKPKPVRRVYIPKSNGKLRPLGIPAVEDKIVQMAITRILNAIYEQDFLECSYGFRPGRGCHEALKALNDMIYKNRINHIIDADIKGFFDNVDHEILIRLLKYRVADSTLLQLIKSFLKGGVMEDDKYNETEIGTPQGGILSPILANIYLHYALDKWIEYVQAKAEGYVGIIRYADDFVICTRYQKTARKVLENLTARMSKYKLELAEDKTRQIEFGKYAKENARFKEKRTETFNFLGITHFCTKNRNGKFKIGRITEKKKFQQKIKELSKWLQGVMRTKAEEWWPILRSKMMGHYQYYGISENSKGIARYYFEAKGLLFKWMNKRSQKKSFNWKEFHNYLKRYCLPKPKIYYSFYVIS